MDRYKEAGFDAVTLSIANEESTTERALVYLAQIRKYIFQHSEKYILAKSKFDILRAKKENKIALRLMFQGTAPIGKNLDLLELFHTLGISSLVLAYNIYTPMGNGVIEEKDSGLSHLGKRFIAEMNRLGMIIDIAHTGYQTAMNAAMLTTLPLVNSHSGVYGIHPHVRNVHNEQIKAVARTGGVIGVNGIGVLLGNPKASVEKYVDHIDYIAKLVGVRYVSLGLDNLYFAEQFNQYMQNQQVTHPEAYANKAGDRSDWQCLQPEDIISIVENLLLRGYVDEDIKKILGRNILRLM
ncbi:dipeptidase [Legionella sp. CNM-1927-20]|uniref:dipeptidase n=1 Tax=Legionella sp. CNM-1927-20 TaxID=3422221 RepID=UPI00403AE8B4